MNNNNKEKTTLFAALLLTTGATFANTHYDAAIPVYDATSVQYANLNNAVPNSPQEVVGPADMIYLDEQPAQQDYMQPAQAQINENDIIYLDEQPTAQTTAAAPANTTYLNEAELAASGIVFLDEMPAQPTAQQPMSLAAIQQPQQPAAFHQGSTAAPTDTGYAMYADQSKDSAQPQVAALTPMKSSSVPTSEVIKAVEAGRIDLLAALEAKGADLNATDSNGLTYLHRAAAAGHVKMSKYLLRSGLSPNASTSKNWTPLHHAARFGHGNVVAALLAAGADERPMTSDGFSPKRLAMNAKKYQVAQLLR